jgi:hypothetical protein
VKEIIMESYRSRQPSGPRDPLDSRINDVIKNNGRDGHGGAAAHESSAIARPKGIRRAEDEQLDESSELDLSQSTRAPGAAQRTNTS